MQLKWSHVVVLVRDMNEMVDFYTTVLGFDVTDRGPFPGPSVDDAEIVFMSQIDTDHHQIAFVDGARDDNPPNSVNHFAFRVDSLDDVKAMDARLEADGRTGDRLPLTHGNAWSVYFSDPEGNGIEVFCDTPWHVSQPQAEIWNVGDTNDEILEATRQKFADRPGFGPAEDFYKRRAEELGDR